MQAARHPERSPDPETRGKGEEPLLPVDPGVLAGVDRVEPRHPGEHGQGEHDRHRVEAPADGEPGPHRRHPQGEAEDDVGERGEALRVRVSEDHRERDRRQREAQRVQHPRGEHERPRGDQDEPPHLAAGEHALRELPPRGAGVARVDRVIGQAVEAHGRAARAHHGHHDPQRLPRSDADTLGRERGRGEGEGQREHGVREADHAPVGQHPLEGGPHASTLRSRASPDNR